MHFLKIHFSRIINTVGCVKKLHAPRCMHKMQAILSVLRYTTVINTDIQQSLIQLPKKIKVWRFYIYSAISALEVIRWNWCLEMNNKFKTNTRSKYICKFEVSDQFRQGSLFRDVFFLFLSNYFSVDDVVYSAEESCI